MKTTRLVSFFEKLYLSASSPRTVEEIIILIRTRRWMHEIIAYRAALAAGDKKGARELKGRLPGFTPSGVFEGGHRANQLKNYNNVVGLDFDHVSNPAALATLFRAQSSTLALFVSPGGEGLKVFVAVDTDREQHAAAFAGVAACYERLSGLFCDRACKDICRCCYVSDDAEAYYNPDATPFSPLLVSPCQLFVHDWLRKHPAAEGNRNETVYRLGCAANRLGFGSAEVASFCVPLLQADDFTEEEMKQALFSAYQGNKEERGAVEADKRTFVDTTDTDTISGEELREQTPFLPENLENDLPPLLGEAVRFYPDRREHDMALLAAITVLSACLPKVWGIYNRKKVYSPLFTIEVAPAANGKGCINDMRHLADSYASLIEVETKRKEEEYLQALEEWEVKKAAAHQKKEPVDLSGAPLKASTCYFFIPTQITKAKLLVHLAENGEIGGLMADSEIDTLISASRQDYGQFDDLLRKAFHHEAVSSSRKTDNEMIRIHSPRLAVLLAGTPGQFSRLVPDAENGLASRLLLYTCRSEAAWQDVSSAGEAEHFDAHIDRLSDRVKELACRLRQRPLRVRLSAGQWKELNAYFARSLRETDLFGSESFLSVVKRHGLMAYRLCMIFTALDVAGLDYGVDERVCSMPHFRAALSIIDVCLAHSRLLMTQLAESPDVHELTCPDSFRRLFEALPEEFTSSDVILLANEMGCSERTVRRHLRRLEPTYLVRLSRGHYRKKSPFLD